MTRKYVYRYLFKIILIAKNELQLAARLPYEMYRCDLVMNQWQWVNSICLKYFIEKDIWIVTQLLVAAADCVGASVLGHGRGGSYVGARVNIAGDTLVRCHHGQWEGKHVCQQLKLTHQHLHANHFIPIHSKSGNIFIWRQVACRSPIEKWNVWSRRLLHQVSLAAPGRLLDTWLVTLESNSKLSSTMACRIFVISPSIYISNR